MTQENHMQVHFDAKSVNEGLARMVVTAFMADMNPTLEQIADVKTAVSEAVTNAIIHGYDDEHKQVELTCDQNGQQLVVTQMKSYSKTYTKINQKIFQVSCMK